MLEVKKIKACRVCGCTSLTPIISFGDQFVSNFVSKTSEEGQKVPLELVLCDSKKGGCGLLQLRHSTPGDWMYRNYWYKSGVNKTMRDALADVAQKCEAIANPFPNDFVIDIGCNDGTLLRSYQTGGLSLVGFEPASNIAPEAQKGTSKIINDYFNADAFEKAFPGKKAKVVTAIAMFYDLDDPNSFVSDVTKCLQDNGIFVIQMSYLPLMLETNNFDNVCHEHLEYYSLKSLEFLLSKQGLEIFDAELNDVNGGSIRTYARKKGARINALEGSERRLAELRKKEEILELETEKPYKEFAARVESEKKKLVDFIKSETGKGKKVFVYGASTKGNTLLQYYSLDSKWLEAAAERNPGKWGKMTVGTHVPIISEEEARKRKPDYFLVLPWHFKKEFLQREKPFLEQGGKFIFPLPKFEVIGLDEIQ